MTKNTVLLTVILCALISTASAQNYYPTDIGNTWVLESTDGAERITYTLETPEEERSGEQFRTLKIITEVLGTSSVHTNTFLIEVHEEGMKLHKAVAELGDVFGISRIEFSPPAVFFPHRLPSFFRKHFKLEKYGRRSERQRYIWWVPLQFPVLIKSLRWKTWLHQPAHLRTV